MLGRKVKLGKMMKARKGQKRCPFMCGGQSSDKGVCGQRLEQRERLSHAASWGWARAFRAVGTGNAKGSDKRNTQRVRGTIRAWSPSVSGEHDIFIGPSTYKPFPVPRFLCHGILRFPESPENTLSMLITIYFPKAIA